MKTHTLATLAVSLLAAGFLTRSHADLVNHWSLDATLADSGPGANPLILRSNAALDSSWSAVGDGSLRTLAATAPADGGAVSTTPTNWTAFPSGDTRTIAFWMKATPNQEANATMFGGGTNSTGTRFDIKVFNNLFRVEIQGIGQTSTPAAGTTSPSSCQTPPAPWRTSASSSTASASPTPAPAPPPS